MTSEKLYSRTPLEEVDLTKLLTVPLNSRNSKVLVEDAGVTVTDNASFGQWLEALPHTLAAADLHTVAGIIASARAGGKGVLLGMGAHLIKTGLGPLIADGMDDGIFTGVATNGASIIHDYELALTGRTSEDVDEHLIRGVFGMAEETAKDLNKAIREGARTGEGIGRAVGRLIVEEDFPYQEKSVFAAAFRNRVPATVHVAIGTDIIHMHPSCDGAATGQASMDDFHLFVRQVCALKNGVFINAGSAVIIPEVFLKACAIAFNLGYTLDNLTTLNMDMFQHYRPRINVVKRPIAGNGRGYSITGHHEILFPLLLAAVRENHGR